MITTSYVKVWMMAKKAMWRLRHPVLTSEHLFYACLRLNDQRHWELCRNLPVTAATVWSHLKENPPSEAGEDFSGVRLGASAKAALERAEVEAAQRGHSATGTDGLMRALLAESDGPVRSLLAAAGPVKPEVIRETPPS
jgi:ATP-dependent Clp protease ATP-binding subunit ClpA